MGVEQLLKNWDGEIPIDPSKLAMWYGVNVIDDSEIGDEQVGFAQFDGTSHTIFVNPRLSKNRRRFTIAHILGHIFNNPKKELMPEVVTNFSASVQNSDEFLANQFAMNLLVPLNVLTLLVNSGKFTTTIELASLFCVSERLMAAQILKLGSRYA